MPTKPRQIRLQITGGIGDLEAWKKDLDEVAFERGFVQSFEEGAALRGCKSVEKVGQVLVLVTPPLCPGSS